jgi:hypothetical protein
MKALQQSRCLNHEFREAVARCPQCRHFFCRECIVEHDDVILCSNCLRQTTRKAESRRSWKRPLSLATQGVFGFLLGWFCFYSLGKNLLELEPDFHEGTIWTQKWWDP